MCSKHVNGLPAAHNHIVNKNVTAWSLLEKYSVVYITNGYVFISDDFVFVNSSKYSLLYVYKTQILHVLCFSFFVVVKKTKPYKIYMFSVCFSIFLFFYLCSVRYRCLPSAIWLSPGECVWAINDLCLLQYIYLYNKNTLTLLSITRKQQTLQYIIIHTQNINIYCVLRL